MDTEIVLEKYLTHFYDTNTKKVGIDGSFLNIISGINEQPTANLIFYGERLIASSLRSRTRQGYLLLPLLFNIILEVLTRAIRQ